MTFAEIVIAALLLVGIIYLLSPLQKFLEAKLQRLLRSKSRGSATVIDVTEYSKKDKK